MTTYTGNDALTILQAMLSEAERSLKAAETAKYLKGQLRATAIASDEGRIFAIREAISRISAA